MFRKEGTGRSDGYSLVRYSISYFTNVIWVACGADTRSYIEYSEAMIVLCIHICITNGLYKMVKQGIRLIIIITGGPLSQVYYFQDESRCMCGGTAAIGCIFLFQCILRYFPGRANVRYVSF